MEVIRFDPIKCAINLAVGWFLFAFLQAVVVSIFSGGWSDLWARFLGIALFRNRTGALINLIAIAVIGGTGTAIWLLVRRQA